MMLIIVAILVMLCIIIVVIRSFPWVVGRVPRVFDLRFSRSDIPILIVSDLHIGNDDSLWFQIFRFVMRDSFRSLVIAGDLIDKRVLFNEKIIYILEKLAIGNIKKVIYVPSSSSHDFKPLPRNYVELHRDSFSCYIVPYVLRISVDGCLGSVYVTHGDYVSRNGIVAHILDVFMQKIFRKPFVGTVLRKILRLGDMDWVVHGHSHVAYYSKEYRVAGTGCWVRRPHESMQRAFAVTLCRDNVIYVEFFIL